MATTTMSDEERLAVVGALLDDKPRLSDQERKALKETSAMVADALPRIDAILIGDE
jgi:hypothetical protein